MNPSALSIDLCLDISAPWNVLREKPVWLTLGFEITVWDDALLVGDDGKDKDGTAAGVIEFDDMFENLDGGSKCNGDGHLNFILELDKPLNIF